MLFVFFLHVHKWKYLIDLRWIWYWKICFTDFSNSSSKDLKPMWFNFKFSVLRYSVLRYSVKIFRIHHFPSVGIYNLHFEDNERLFWNITSSWDKSLGYTAKGTKFCFSQVMQKNLKIFNSITRIKQQVPITLPPLEGFKIVAFFQSSHAVQNIFR